MKKKVISKFDFPITVPFLSSPPTPLPLSRICFDIFSTFSRLFAHSPLNYSLCDSFNIFILGSFLLLLLIRCEYLHNFTVLNDNNNATASENVCILRTLFHAPRLHLSNEQEEEE